MAVSRLSIVKFIELLLTIACIGLHYKSITGDRDTDFVSAGAFCGYLVILLGGFAGHLMSTPISRRIDIFFCLVGCAAFVAAGALNIKIFENHWRGETRNYGLAKASLAIINGAVFLVDSLLTWRGHLRGSPINRNVNILYSFAGCVLFLAAGALNIIYFRHTSKYTNDVRDYGIAKASLAIINSAVFLSEAIYTLRDMN